MARFRDEISKGFVSVILACDMLSVLNYQHRLLFYMPFSFTFADIDECAAGVANCLPGQICFNTQGAFECRVDCQDGFRYDPA